MKGTLILILTVLFVSCNNRTIEISDANIKTDQYFYNNDYKPFNGSCKINYINNESLKIESFYKNGLLNGQTTLYFENGEICRKGNYAAGKYEGLWEGWFKNGNKEFEINYKSGKLNGQYIAYYENGSLKEKGKYQNNTRVKEWSFFDKNGNEVSKKIY